MKQSIDILSHNATGERYVVRVLYTPGHHTIEAAWGPLDADTEQFLTLHPTAWEPMPDLTAWVNNYLWWVHEKTLEEPREVRL